MKKGFQTREAEMDLAQMLGNLAEQIISKNGGRSWNSPLELLQKLNQLI